MPAWVYILQCRTGQYYVGSTMDVESRLVQHEQGIAANWTAKRRPVKLVFAEMFYSLDEAFHAERQIKGWRREKKEALIARRFDLLPELAATAKRPRILRRAQDGYVDADEERESDAP